MIIRNFLMTNWHARVLKTAVVYNLVVFLIFMVVYLLMDFSKHFTSAAPITTSGKLYYCVMAHTSVGSNDILPKTDAARMVSALHVTLAWIQLMLAFVV